MLIMSTVYVFMDCTPIHFYVMVGNVFNVESNVDYLW